MTDEPTEEPARTREGVEKLVYDSLVKFGADPDGLSLETNLEKIDVDSLDMAELAQIVENAYDVVLKSGDLKAIVTVSDVVEMIFERLDDSESDAEAA